eukprot:TRINITY_DN36342_c0_g1_i1.p1 TRINITY_DN36342_c0_g1~~TRINITY_DN36342_c0_g1_i1.p1  ORF type:complete len:523 (-),score=128.37 TRINITY_DN36342_c0_g1_i1:219-1787(-)
MATETVDVVVVGGGVAGIAAAVSLAQRGLSVKMVESRPQLGGRARSWVDKKTQDPIHIGPHVVITEYPNFFKLLELLGTREKLAWQPTRHFLTWVKGQQEYHMKTAPLPAPFSWGPAAILDPLCPLEDKQTMLGAVVRCLSLDEDGIMALDEESGADFLRRAGVAEPYIQHFWAFVSHAILNVPIEEVSAAALVRFFRGLVSRTDMEMGFSDCGLGELFMPAKELLPSLGASLVMGTEVVEFLGDAECTGVKLDTGDVVHAKMGVISTLPPQTVLPLLPKPWVEQHASIRDLEALKPCKYLCVYIWFDRKVSGGRQMWARTYNKNDLNCEFYDFSEIYSGTDANGVLWKDRPSFVGSNIIDSGRCGEMSDEELVEGTLREMEEFYTDVRKAKVLHWRVNRVPMAIHRPVVGTEKLRPDQATPVNGLYFGGCWTKTHFPGSMESAARGGFLAAERLLERQGLGKEGDISLTHTPVPMLGKMIGTLEHFPLVQKLIYNVLAVCTPPFFGVVSRLMGNQPPASKL